MSKEVFHEVYGKVHEDLIYWKDQPDQPDQQDEIDALEEQVSDQDDTMQELEDEVETLQETNLHLEHLVTELKNKLKQYEPEDHEETNPSGAI